MSGHMSKETVVLPVMAPSKTIVGPTKNDFMSKQTVVGPNERSYFQTNGRMSDQIQSYFQTIGRMSGRMSQQTVV